MAEEVEKRSVEEVQTVLEQGDGGGTEDIQEEVVSPLEEKIIRQVEVGMLPYMHHVHLHVT